MPALHRQLLLLRLYAAFTYPFACVPFLYLYFARNGLDLTGYGLVISTYYLAMFVAEVPTGMLADRFGRKWMLVLGPLLLALGFGTLLVWRNMTGFCAGEALLGIGHSVLSGPPSALLYDSLRRDGAAERFLREESALHALRLYGTGGSFLLGGLVAVWSDGYGATILLTCGLLLVASLTALGLHEPERPRATRREFLAAGLADLRQRPVLWLLAYFVVLFALLRYPFHNYQVALDEAARNVAVFGHPLFVGGLYAALNFAAAPMSRRVPHLVERYGRRVLFWAMPLALAASLAAMAIEQPWLWLLLFFAQQIPFGMHWSLVQEFANHRLQPLSRTTVLSVLSLGGRLFYAGVNVLLFALQSRHGLATAMLVAGGGGAVLCCAVMWARPRGLLRGDRVDQRPRST